MTAPEFARPHPIDRIGTGGEAVRVAADAAERAALARRFALIAIDSLEASYALRREAGGVRATGHLSARATQACVVTGDPCPASVEEDFDLRFLPEPGSGGEVELSAEEADTIFFTGDSIDLGEAAAETMALALDPFPRGPAADAALREAAGNGKTGPFAALAALKGKLGGD